MSLESVCASVGEMADSAWSTTKNAAGDVGNFCGRMATKVSNFWHDSVMPFIQRVVDAAKGFFGKAKDWAEKNPETLRAVVITAVASIITTAAIMWMCGRDSGNSGDGKDGKGKKEEKKA